ncbi:MAG: hypothetical protein GXO79_06615 [Chlorobi bacterium]|nr:hypothetical protein [Chlorobiota bacterium]
MKKIVWPILISIFIVGCQKEDETYINKFYDFLKFELYGNTETYDSTGNLISETIHLNENELFKYPGHEYFMKSIEITSESTAIFYYLDSDSLESTINSNYSKYGNEITFVPITTSELVDSAIVFIDSSTIIKAPCTGLKFIWKTETGQSTFTFKTFGILPDSMIYRWATDHLEFNDTLFVQKFYAIYQEK